MGCVEIDVETDSLKYHPDIDCCPVESRTHHCMNAFSNVCFVPYPVVSIQTDNCGNDVIGTIITTNDLGE